MSVEDALRKEQGSEPDEADVEAMFKLAEDTGVTKCLTSLSDDPTIFRALTGLTGFALESGWDAWRSQCGSVTGPKGPCIEAEGRAGQDLQSINADPTSQRISGICQNLISDRKPKNAPETENRTWLACLKAGVKVHPTAHALDECRFVSASASTPVVDTMVRCFQDKANQLSGLGQRHPVVLHTALAVDGAG
ncbi:hypothetical protein MKK69_19440 [Methylobacterium sp. J-026]|uniref:hypothetical protein n=1 Tax=Methylobacterium sp. J-026 TaxID=2836624 RepID=UPI001FBADEC0|nr:hypothetical protein [Methylobacterium sp. J-026]MCJ2136198.1 hypothetical protein [Methylobacterium sp. J-026]